MEVKGVSKEIVDLANKAAQLRRDDIKANRPERKMKEYFTIVLNKAGFDVTDERLEKMGRVLGRRGGAQTAMLIKAGVIVPKRRAPGAARNAGDEPTPPRRFNEYLFPLNSPHR